MSYISRYDKGNWIANCDVCGRKYKASSLTKRWDGLMCCNDDWEIRQPQDFVKGQADHQVAPWIRSESSDSFLPITITQFFVGSVQNTVNIITELIYGPPRRYTKVFVSTILTRTIRFFTTGTKEINGSIINFTTLG